ncbi:hypothetical protein [Falsiroseomonas sp.]|uniref:hypothetical protein n=1 Tax=Falsiroseomonas sp. TaxID=2870721 RepID=UPI00271D9B7E|nr:hypothetical protein [Falsiroseomonas sp.]MDO9503066.1 hypothetical protein [Falsiroseomonas sp.]
MESKLHGAGTDMPDLAPNAEVAELVAIWRSLPSSRRHLLLEQVRKVARAEYAGADALEPAGHARN